MSRHDGKVWVRKLRTGYSTHPWEVRARNHNGYDHYETFYDWADAMEAADRLARTHEVVLPRLSKNGERTVDRIEFDPVTITHHPHQLVKLALGKWEGIGLTYAELEPVALYLLALARREEERDEVQ